MLINWARKEMNLKIVYYGPGLSGKTTNLQQIHAHINPSFRSEIVSLKTTQDRTLYFDFMQVQLRQIASLTPRLHLYTVPGQPQYEVSRRLVLRGTDGVVFVADSQHERLMDNLNSWLDMAKQLSENGISLVETPIVVQFNKRDLADALRIEAMKDALRLDHQFPVIPSVATEGTGVHETLSAIVRAVIGRVNSVIDDARARTAQNGMSRQT